MLVRGEGVMKRTTKGYVVDADMSTGGCAIVGASGTAITATLSVSELSYMSSSKRSTSPKSPSSS